MIYNHQNNKKSQLKMKIIKIASLLLPISFNCYSGEFLDFFEEDKVQLNFGVVNMNYSEGEVKNEQLHPLVGYDYQLYDKKTKFGLSLYGNDLLQSFLSYDFYSFGKVGLKFKSSLDYRFEEVEGKSMLTPSFGVVGVYNLNNKWKFNVGYDYQVDEDSMISAFVTYRFGIHERYSISSSIKTNEIVDYVIKEPMPKLILKDTAEGLFGYDSYALTNKAKETLYDFIDSLDADRIQNIYIQGHTDSKGDERYNWNLSRERAKAVFEFFAKYSKIETEKINYYGLGETKPISSIDSKNRRVEILVHYAYPDR